MVPVERLAAEATYIRISGGTGHFPMLSVASGVMAEILPTGVNCSFSGAPGHFCPAMTVRGPRRAVSRRGFTAFFGAPDGCFDRLRLTATDLFPNWID